MKYFIKISVLTILFIGAIYFFGSSMDETVFNIEKNTTKMADAALPIVYLRSDEVVINPLHGYVSNLDLLSIREHIISVEEEQVLELVIEEQRTDVRKLQYEIIDTVTGTETATGTINAFEKEEEQKIARIKISEKLQSGREYAAKVTLITSESKRVYYYFRIKYYADTQLKEKVDYILSFSQNLRDKNYNAVIPYLESTYRDEGTTYAYIDIKDSFYMACWGDLEPKLLSEPELSLSEIYSNIAVGTLKYMVEFETDTGLERYYVTERFRITCQGDSKHLLNYERNLEAVFDVAFTSLSQSQFKLGITTDTDMELVTNSDNSMLAFVRNKELWHYNLAENQISKVFSFSEITEQGIPGAWGNYDQHDIRILGMEDSGDLSFMIYGYMNRGEYEGKTGIILYRYYRSENRVEEILYLPINETYQQIKEELGNFSYMNAYNVFYFMAYHTMYSYDLITQELQIISTATLEKDVVFSRETGYVAWQEIDDYSSIHLIYLESGEKKDITAKDGEFIRLLGKIDENMICGNGRLSDCTVLSDGTMFYPAYQVQIMNSAMEVVKTYYKEGYYVTEADVSENSIRLYRSEKSGSQNGNSYKEAEDDYILNYEAEGAKPISLVSRITERTFLEYYIDLPSAYVMKVLPIEGAALNTVIDEDTTVRIPELEHDIEEYMVYSFGRIAAIYENCTDAIALADTTLHVGTVINEQGKVVWERGVKYSAYYLSDITGVSCKESGLTSRQAAVKMIVNRLGKEADVSQLEAGTNMKEFLESYLDERVISLVGITLDEALYFVYKDVPVLAMKNATDAVLITGYNANNVVYYDPATGQSKTVSQKEAQEMFSKAGDIYISYLK